MGMWIIFSLLTAFFETARTMFSKKKDIGAIEKLVGEWQYFITINAQNLEGLSKRVHEVESIVEGEIEDYLPIIVIDQHKSPKVPLGMFDILTKQLTKQS